jgi:hypothetical protein
MLNNSRVFIPFYQRHSALPEFMLDSLLGVKVEDDLALKLLRGTVPTAVRNNIVLDKERMIDKQTLFSIENQDTNFRKLQIMTTNSKHKIELASDKGVTFPQLGYVEFEYQTAEEQIQGIVSANNSELVKLGMSAMNPQETQQFITDMRKEITRPSFFLGQTYSPQLSPTGNLRIVVSDGGGKASSAGFGQLTSTMGHELYLHAYLFVTGEPWEHIDKNGNPISEDSPDDILYTKRLMVESLTRKNSLGEVKKWLSVRKLTNKQEN